MPKVSAGRVYFGALALASIVVFLAALLNVGPHPGLLGGLSLGFVFGAAVLLVGLSALLLLFHVSLESKVRFSAFFEALGG